MNADHGRPHRDNPPRWQRLITLPPLGATLEPAACGELVASEQKDTPSSKEVAVPVWAWVLIIVLLVLLLSGGIYVRR